MIPRNGSYFDSELCLEGHYVVTGYTNDLFCNDRLQITDIRQELHRHLLEQGFEVVVFFDHNDMLYCYDQRSFDILEGRNTPPARQEEEEPEDEFAAMCSEGPFGRNISQEEEPQAPQAQPPRNSGSFQMGRLSMSNAWHNVIALMQRGEHRCALVISNASSLQTTFADRELQALQEIAQQRSENTDKNSIVIYLFRGNAMTNMLNSAELGTTPWGIFFRSTLLPVIQTEDPERNRVISLRTPNASEIRNLLVCMRTRQDAPLNIRPQDIPSMAVGMASGCAENNWSLQRLYHRLQRHCRDNPHIQLCAGNYCACLGLRNQNAALEDLERMIGLDDIKEKIRQRYAGSTIGRNLRGLPDSSCRFLPPERGTHINATELNLCLVGNPGTGKTAIASLMGRVYRESGLLPQGHLVRVSAGDLVSQNVGGTTALVRDWVQQALGGVLFIDEAYALQRNAHGREAIDQLVNDMTTYAGQFAVIIAGYPQDINRLLQANDGLASRFGETWHLPDYTPEQMRQILELFIANDPEGLTISPELVRQLPVFCMNWAMDHGSEWGNAREAESLTAAMKQRAKARLSRTDPEHTGSLELLPADIPAELQHHCKPKAASLEEALEALDKMIGLKNVKRFLRGMVQNIRTGVSDSYLGRFIFYGPPGTGKTHTARLMGTMLWRLGVLNRAYVHEVTAAQLLSPDASQDYGNGREPTLSEILEKAVENARGGILFIDEAHQLALTPEGRAVLRALVPIVENPEIRKDTCFILAGYTLEMRNLLEVDDGLARRFPVACRIRFDNYTPSELVAILEDFATARKETLTQEYKDRTRLAMSKYLESPQRNFGNAGFMRDTYLEQSIVARSRRLSAKYGGSPDAVLTVEQSREIFEQEKHQLTGEDIPASFVQWAGPQGLPVPPELSVWDRVEQLVGKPQVREYLLQRKNADLQPVFYDAHSTVGMNFALAGNIGSGRHTTARVIAAVLKEVGMLDRDEVTFVSKGDLEAGWVGQTAEKAAEVVERARGACLVVEYPSSMLRKNSADNTFGPEALGVIAGAMSSTTDQLAVILLDTEDGLKETFRQFPDLRSRMSHIFTLEDLSPADMEALFRRKTENAMCFEPGLKELIPEFFLNWVSDRGGLGEEVRSWGNGTELDMLTEDLIAGWKNCGQEIRRDGGINKRYITAAMFPKRLQKYLTPTRAAADTAMQKLNDMVGLTSVKEAVAALERRIRLLGRERVRPGCYAFMGTPGTGKTTVAKLMGGVLRAAKVLEQGHVIERTAQQMAEDPTGLDDLLKLAKNGILFIDEAPQLLNYKSGHTVIKRLLTVLTNPEIMDCTCIILAGYPKEMMQLIRLDPGLESRFGKQDSMIIFEDYKPEELLQILQEKAAKADRLPEINAVAPLQPDEEYLRLSLQVFRGVVAEKNPNFGNARFVVNYLHDSMECMLSRVDPQQTGVQPESRDLTVLTEEDIPPQHRSVLTRQEQPAMLTCRQLTTNIPGPITEENYRERNQQLIRGTVLLECYAKGQKRGEGSGMILTEDGYVLTCAHVVNGCDRIRAKVSCPGNMGGDYFWKECTLLRPVHPNHDLALLKMEGCNYSPLPVRHWAKPVNALERTLLIGYPLGGMLNEDNLDELNASSFEGRISSKQTPVKTQIRRCYIDSTGHHGNSGSPVISWEDGCIIGVFTGSISPDESKDEANWFRPISYFWELFVADIPRNEIADHDQGEQP